MDPVTLQAVWKVHTDSEFITKDVEATLETKFLRFISFDLRQPADAVPLQAAMQGRARQMRDAWLQGIQAIIQRQQRVFAKGHNRSFFLLSQNR